MEDDKLKKLTETEAKTKVVGSSLQLIGCLMTLFISVPIVLVIIYLTMCSGP